MKTTISSLKQVRPSFWSIYLLFGVVMTALYFAQSSREGQHIFYVALGLSSVAMIIYGAHRNELAQRMPWYLFAAGNALFICGDLIRAYYETVGGVEAPFPGLADAAYLLAYPVLTAGLLMLIYSRDPMRDRGTLIDALTLAVAVGLISWVFVIEPYAQDHTLTIGERVISMAYPLADLILIAGLLRLAIGPGARTVSYYFLGISFVALCVADTALAIEQFKGIYATGDLLDAGFLISYMFWGAAALHPSVQRMAEPGSIHEVMLTRKRLALLAAVALMAPAIRVYQIAAHQQSEVGVVVGGTIVLFMLVLARISGLVQMLTSSLEKERKAEEKRRKTEARFSSLVQHSHDIVAVLDAERNVIYASPSIANVLGRSPESLENRDFGKIIHADDLDSTTARFEAILNDHDVAGGRSRLEFRAIHSDGTHRNLEAVVTNLLNDTNVGGVVLNIRDITERTVLEAELRHQAFHDPLTDLANRALFRDRVEHALASRARRNDQVGVLFLDIDDFKKVNDSLGHSAGDELLLAVADRINACIRGGDTAARIGGDEFAILLEETEDARRIASRVQEALRMPFRVFGREISISASIGICISGVTGDTDELLRNADTAMYMAKSLGKDRWEVFDSHMHALAMRRLDLEGELRRSIESGEFTLHYQPIVRLDTLGINAFEALVRWVHPERGLVAPDEFIPMSEDTGLIKPLGRWVLEEACRQARKWQVKYPSADPFGISVNLSVGQLSSATLVDDVQKALDRSGLAPSSLILEITENVLISDHEANIQRLHDLKSLGLRVAIDDFGTGFSSLNYLQRFPVDWLKIDRSFVREMIEDKQRHALVRGIVELGRNLSLDLVAEGIENEEQLKMLIEMGCTMGQGYHFARPQSARRIERMLSKERVGWAGQSDFAEASGL